VSIYADEREREVVVDHNFFLIASARATHASVSPRTRRSSNGPGTLVLTPPWRRAIQTVRLVRVRPVGHGTLDTNQPLDR
jgi:hypothetical protein